VLAPLLPAHCAAASSPYLPASGCAAVTTATARAPHFLSSFLEVLCILLQWNAAPCTSLRKNTHGRKSKTVLSAATAVPHLLEGAVGNVPRASLIRSPRAAATACAPRAAALTHRITTFSPPCLSPRTPAAHAYALPFTAGLRTPACASAHSSCRARDGIRLALAFSRSLRCWPRIITRLPVPAQHAAARMAA